MRATELLGQKSGDELKTIASALKAPTPDVPSILAAMRSADTIKAVLKACETVRVKEDLALVCANPFDPIAPDELYGAATFEKFGLIHFDRSAAEYHVNIDLALTLLPRTPVEFGFTATLLARLAPEQLSAVARSMQVGPRPSVIDTILDVAAAVRAQSLVMQHVAHLREAERAVLLDALAAGPLPDDASEIPWDAEPPSVVLDEGEAGRRGLVFWIDQEERGIDSRPLVSLEMAEFLPKVLEKVPPPPEMVDKTAKPKARRTVTAAPRKKVEKAEESRGAFSPLFPGLNAASAPVVSSAAEPIVRKSDDVGPVINRSVRSAKVSSVRTASAIVVFDSNRQADALRKDDELGSAVLDVVAESIVVLRPGIDARDWTERATFRLQHVHGVPWDSTAAR